jgi:hypothetical protein
MNTTDWRTSAACRGEDPDLWFPLSDDVRWALQIEQAKAICNRCPVRGACLAAALREEGARRDRYGIRGGLADTERRQLRRRKDRGTGTTQRTLPPAATLTEALNRRATPTSEGHLHWPGVPHITFQGQRYTVLQAAFTVGWGRQPVGIVRRTCTDGECIRYDHLSDEEMRDAEDRCGTRAGYLRHRELGEDCERCRRANTDADNRLRRTGTTKQVAV